MPIDLFRKRTIRLIKIVCITAMILCPLASAYSQLFQIGGSASLRIADGETHSGIYTAEGSFTIIHFKLFGAGNDFSMLTINAGARFDQADSADIRFFTELVYWNFICLGAGATIGTEPGLYSLHLMIGEIIPIGIDLLLKGNFWIPIIIIFVRPTWEEAAAFNLDLGIKIKFTIPLGAEF